MARTPSSGQETAKHYGFETTRPGGAAPLGQPMTTGWNGRQASAEPLEDDDRKALLEMAKRLEDEAKALRKIAQG